MKVRCQDCVHRFTDDEMSGRGMQRYAAVNLTKCRVVHMRNATFLSALYERECEHFKSVMDDMDF